MTKIKVGNTVRNRITRRRLGKVSKLTTIKVAIVGGSSFDLGSLEVVGKVKK